MEFQSNFFFRALAGLFGSILVKRGLTSLSAPGNVAREFGLPLRSLQAGEYVPVMGIREIACGSTLIVFLAADYTGIITDGKRSTALVTGTFMLVGIGDGLLVQSRTGKGFVSHAIGTVILGFIAAGLWLTA